MDSQDVCKPPLDWVSEHGNFWCIGLPKDPHKEIGEKLSRYWDIADIPPARVIRRMVSRTETNNPRLRYVSIADDLQRQIESGEVRDGERLPSQHQMAKQYGVSLTTLRSAVDLLEQRGLVRSAHGLGTFAQAPVPGKDNPQVLLVDDDPQVVDLLTAILEGEDLTVTSAATAAEGIAKLESSSFQAVFLDLIMPGGSGVDLLKAVELQENKTPVVLVTGAADSALINEAMEHGPITLIRKPVRVKQVRQVLEVLGVQKQAKAQVSDK